MCVLMFILRHDTTGFGNFLSEVIGFLFGLRGDAH